MVGDRKCGIPLILRPPDQFERDKFSVAEYGVSMQIYHPKKIQEDREKCKAISSKGKVGIAMEVSILIPRSGRVLL